MMVLKKILKNIFIKFRYHIMKICVKTKFFSDLYYLLFSNAFSREHRSVLAGKLRYLNDVESEKSSFYLLIRNTHRIEKGLLMKPRRAVFAKGYIEETLDGFEKVWAAKKDLTNGQLKWFTDVFDKYFEACSGDDYISRLQKRYKAIVANDGYGIDSQGKVFAPYIRKLENDKTITFDQFYNLTRQRRSVRWFLDKEVPRDLIDKAIFAAVQSPSACNRQPFEYRIIDDPKYLEKVVNLPMGTSGYAHNIPVMVITIGNLDAYFSERDRHLIYIDASLANMTFMYALETLGLSSCPINWPDIEPREIKMEKLLGLKKYQRPIMCMGIGYPDPKEKVAYSKKKELELIRSYNSVN